MLSSLATRERIPELMDEPGLETAEHQRALNGLARINRWSRSDAILWPNVLTAARNSHGSIVKILDVATGAGDVPFNLWRRANRAKIPVEIHACDISETALDYAQEKASRDRVPIHFFRHDAVAAPLPGGFDLVTASLFLHHLSDDAGVTLFRRMSAAGRAIAVNDLARSRFGYALAWMGTRLLSRSRIVHFDGPASVRSAFTPDEALALAERAGLRGAKVEPRWPCRYLLTWSRT